MNRIENNGKGKQVLSMPRINQHGFEFEIHQCLKFGVETELAKASGKSVAYYSSMLNPNDERESSFFKAAQDFVNWLSIDPDGFNQAYAIFRSHIERHTVLKNLSATDEIALSIKEDADAVNAYLKGEPDSAIIREFNEAVEQKQKARDAVVKRAMERLEKI